MKKKIIILSFIFLLILGFLIYFVYTNYIPHGFTGAIYTPPSVSEIEEAKAVDNLQNDLPLQSSLFSIYRFDYSQGRFIVSYSTTSATFSEDFGNWLENSSYSAIPKSMFFLQQEFQEVGD